jgi:hypothetical protein
MPRAHTRCQRTLSSYPIPPKQFTVAAKVRQFSTVEISRLRSKPRIRTTIFGGGAWAFSKKSIPSYPSNHGSAANGAATVMRRLYGEGGQSITLTNPAVPSITLRYTAFKQITDDISDARVYGGIHFRTDQQAGADLGRAVGSAVHKNNLRPAQNED